MDAGRLVSGGAGYEQQLFLQGRGRRLAYESGTVLLGGRGLELTG